MAAEVWLRTNARAIWFGSVPPTLVGLLGLVLLVGVPGHEPAPWMRVTGAVVLVLSGLTIVSLLWQLRQPRLAYADGHLLVSLRSGPPIRVPIEAVECFWLGQAPTLLHGKQHQKAETSAIVVRIADASVDWQRADVKPQLGKWCEGYITIRGTWCEPLSISLVNRLNERLVAVTREVKARQTAS